MPPDFGHYFLGQLSRHLRIAMRRPGDVFNPLLFFAMVVTLFPLGLGPEPDKLEAMAPGILWVVALLSNLTVSGRLFAADFEDGTLEQMALSPHPLGLCALAEVAAHWLLGGVALALLSPVFGAMLSLSGSAYTTLVASLALGSLSLSLIGAIGASLTVGLRRGGLLLSLLIMPLYVPVLIFGVGAVTEAALGTDPSAWLALLGAVSAFGLVITPIAVGAGLRISLEN